jgi:hypothetical protein
VTFVADVAEALGLSAPMVPKLSKKPKSFLQKVTRDNYALITTWDSHRLDPAAPVQGLQAGQAAHP